MAKTYTAHGSKDKKTALIIKYLMRNPHLQDRAYTGTHTARIGRHTSHSNVTYTIKGNTDRKTALRLKKLFQNSKHISVTVNITYQTISNTLTSNTIPPTSPSTHLFTIRAYRPYSKKGNMLMYSVRINDRQVAEKVDDVAPIYKKEDIVASR